MGDSVDGLLRAFLGRNPAQRADNLAGGYIVEGIVVDASASGVRFTLPAFDEYTFGPAPAPIVDLATTPARPSPGDRCLVIFVGGGVANPWVVSYATPLQIG